MIQLKLLNTCLFFVCSLLSLNLMASNLEASNTPYTVRSSLTFSDYSIPVNNKVSSVTYTSLGTIFSMQYRPRTELDVFESTCLVKSSKLYNCISEYPDAIPVLHDDKFSSNEPIAAGILSSDIKIIDLSPGLKLTSFTLDLDDVDKTKIQSKKMTATEHADIYQVMRVSSVTNQWSGQKVLVIREHSKSK